MLANFGERHATPRILTLIAGGILAGASLLVGLLGSLIQLLAYASGTESVSKFLQAEQTLLPFAAAGLLGLLFLWPVIQRAAARILPIRPGSPVIYLTVILGLLLVAQQLSTQVTSQPPLTYGELLAQDVPFLILAFVGVGLFIRRSPRETIERLGLLPPRQKRWWLIAVVGIGVFMAVAFGIEALANVVAPSQQKQVTDVTTVLFSRFNNPAAIVFLGVLAGVVEETLFRGALLPRFGIVVTAILFAALHIQYAVSFATLEVFVLGLGLGWLRVRSGSTLTGMVTHAGYDIAVGFLSLVAK
ncbi:MAG: protease family protein [Chloroflexota bacterium]|nr:protease family protein [Chloroflexota bacterium]MEA2669621.1 protease family protein [Chloroflexota bacterium]